MQVGLQAGTALHDPKGTIRDASQEFRRLWAEERDFRQAVSEVLEAP